METKLRLKQLKLNKEYDTNGLSDELLNKQVELNKLRHEHDIPDKMEKIYKNYVQ